MDGSPSDAMLLAAIGERDLAALVWSAAAPRKDASGKSVRSTGLSPPSWSVS
jgi:hypothetical protein